MGRHREIPRLSLLPMRQMGNLMKCSLVGEMVDYKSLERNGYAVLMALSIRQVPVEVQSPRHRRLGDLRIIETIGTNGVEDEC